MKYILMLLFTFPAFATDVCDIGTSIFGQSSSFEKKSGKIQLVTQDYELPYVLSEHTGLFNELVIVSPKSILKMKAFKQEFILEKIKNSSKYKTKGFDLNKKINKANFEGLFKIELIGPNEYSCHREFKVVHAE